MVDRSGDEISSALNDDPHDETLEPIQVDSGTRELLMAFEDSVTDGRVETVPEGRIRDTFGRLREDNRKRREALG